MMVVLILAALMSIAGPFALSMYLYERDARHFRDTVRARLAAEGAVAHAIAVLRRTEDGAEKAGVYGAPWNTPDCDTQAELDVFFKFAGKLGNRLKEAGVEFDDPAGVIWSARVEDEQGKMNLISAAPRVIGGLIRSANLAAALRPGDPFIVLDDASLFHTDDDPKTVDGRVCIWPEVISYTVVVGNRLEGLGRPHPRGHRAGALVYDAAAVGISSAAQAGRFKTLFELKRFLSPEDFERIQPYVTVHSYRDTETGWLANVLVLNRFNSGSRSFRVASVNGFATGARVRFLENDNERSVNRILWARQRGQFGHFGLYQPIGWTPAPGATVHAQPEQFHPVNVNTAAPSVLAALFTGVGQRGSLVGRLEAEAVADYVYKRVRGIGRDGGGRPIASHADLKVALEACRASGYAGGGFKRSKVEAILQDATGTICFKAYGNFTIEAAGAVNTPAGEESARHVVRELVTMPVESGGRWTISSQHDFDEQASRLVARKAKTWPFMEPPTREPSLTRYKRRMDPRTGEDREGYVTLETGHSASPVQARQGFVEHFDKRGGIFRGGYHLTHDGAVLRGGAISAQGSSVFKTGSRGDCEPVTISMWLRPDGTADPVGIVSGGGSERNGISLTYSRRGMFGPEFVVTVADACAGQGGQAPGQPGAQAPWLGPAEFHFPAPTLEFGDWYHVAFQVKGTGLGDAHVWVDGTVPESVTPPYYSPSARLNQDLWGAEALTAEMIDGTEPVVIDSIMVEDASVFPPKGAVLIDGEVIEYTEKTGTSFERCRRARRYTHLARHVSGTVVTPYGYSVAPVQPMYHGKGKIDERVGDLGSGPTRWRGPETRLEKRAIDETQKQYELLGADDTDIPVLDTDGFQESGYVRIGRVGVAGGETRPAGDMFGSNTDIKRCVEYVFYGSKSDDGKRLQNCTRARFTNNGSGRALEGREFMLNGTTTVRQISIAVTGDLSQFRARWSDDGGQGPTSGDDCYACLIPEPGQPGTPVEWIWIGRKETVGGVTYLLGWRRWWNSALRVYDRAPCDSWQNWRGRCETVYVNPGDKGKPSAELPRGTIIVPVFRVRGPQCGDYDSPRGFEYVTVAEGSAAEPELRLITHAHAAQWHSRPNSSAPWTHHFRYRVSFGDELSRDYSTSGRVLKFPSGEFMRQVPAQLVVGAAPNAGQLVGAVDEVRAERSGSWSRTVMAAVGFSSPPGSREPAGIGNSATSITVMADMAADGGQLPGRGAGRGRPSPKRSGVAKIEDEYIYYDSTAAGPTAFVPWGKEQISAQKHCPYRDPALPSDQYRDCCAQGDKRKMQTVTLNGCVRGLFGSRISFHGAGARVSFVEWMPLTVLTSGRFGANADSFSVRDGSLFADEGYVVMSKDGHGARPDRGEIVGYTRRFSGARYLRGRYGTGEVAHLNGDFVLSLPFRYWDRFCLDFERESDLAYFQASCAARGARWQSIEWMESGFFGGAATDRVRLRVQCRFDGEPDWDERPTNRYGGLWEFTGGGVHHFRSAGGGPLVADSIEVRVLWEYLTGAYGLDANDWKRNCRLENLTVTYGNPLVVRKVDLLDY